MKVLLSLVTHFKMKWFSYKTGDHSFLQYLPSTGLHICNSISSIYEVTVSFSGKARYVVHVALLFFKYAQQNCLILPQLGLKVNFASDAIP